MAYGNPFSVCVLRLARIVERGEEAIVNWDGPTSDAVDKVLQRLAKQLKRVVANLPKVKIIECPKPKRKKPRAKLPGSAQRNHGKGRRQGRAKR